MQHQRYKLVYSIIGMKYPACVKLGPDREELERFAKALKGCNWSIMEYRGLSEGYGTAVSNHE